MSESNTRLVRAEHDVDKAEAILGKTEQVLEAVGKMQAAPKSTRVLLRVALVVGGVALLVVAVVSSRARH